MKFASTRSSSHRPRNRALDTALLVTVCVRVAPVDKIQIPARRPGGHRRHLSALDFRSPLSTCTFGERHAFVDDNGCKELRSFLDDNKQAALQRAEAVQRSHMGCVQLALLSGGDLRFAASFLQCLNLVSFAMRVYLKRDEKEAEIMSRVY